MGYYVFILVEFTQEGFVGIDQLLSTITANVGHCDQNKVGVLHLEDTHSEYLGILSFCVQAGGEWWVPELCLPRCWVILA